MFRKFTEGWVEQTFDASGKLVDQRFVCGYNQVWWEDDSGYPIPCPDDSWYYPFEMVQPANEVTCNCEDCNGDCSTCEQ